MPDPQPTRRLVLVAGTGRSGTSTLVGVLQRHGFHVPLPEVETDDSNPRGFGEPRWVVDLHGRLLRRAKVQVADSRPAAWEMAAAVAADDAVRARVRGWLEEQFGVADQLVVKDPRSLWFLPLWTEVAREMGIEPSFVTMLRPPPETVGSRRSYYNRQLEDPHGIASWLNLMTGTEHATRGLHRSFVRYHDLLDDWRPVVERLWSCNGLGDTPPVPSEDPGAFIDPGLRRMRLTWEDLELPARLEALTLEAATALDALAATTGVEDRELHTRLDRARASYAAYYGEAESVAHSSVIAARQTGRSGPATSRGPRATAATSGRSWQRGVAETVRATVPAKLRQRLRRPVRGS